MSIDVNETPDTSPEDQEVLRRVYQAQLDEYREQHHDAANRAQRLAADIEPLEQERRSKLRIADRLEGRMDELRRLAARDGITLQ